MGFFNLDNYHNLISGRKRGLQASLLRGMLRVAEVPYTAAVVWRNRRFDRGSREIVEVDVPVISVGNITTGGVGKTPLVEWLARWFRQRGVRVVLVSRGYGAQEGAKNDEALELEQKLPDVPHLQNPNRVEAAQMAIEEFESQLILLDDAFQHRRIARDLSIVLIDAAEPFGYGHLLPRGLLREPLAGLRRADLVALTRADMLDEAERAAIRKTVARSAPQADWAEMSHRPQSLLSIDDRQANIDSLAGKKIAAFCGIGNPDGFMHTLKSCGLEPIAFRTFSDHHNYNRDDIEKLTRWAEAESVEAILCTHKDLVKIGVSELAGRPLWALSIAMEILEGSQQLEALLQPLLAKIQSAESTDAFRAS